MFDFRNNNRLLFVLMAGLSLLLTSCHSEHVSLDYTVYGGAQWNTEHSKIALVASKSAYRRAKGIAAFPDGGIPDYLIKDAGLYVFNPKNKQLTEVVDFTDITELLGNSKGRYAVKIVFNDALIYYSIKPVSGWDFWIEHSNDSGEVGALKEKYSKTYAYNINEKEVTIVDSSLFSSAYQKNQAANRANRTELNRKLSALPLADWGLVIQDIYPKSDKAYIEETIYLHNGSAITRRAVIEQIISKRSKQEIKDLLKKMDEYKNSLESYEKAKYEFSSKDTYKWIQSLL